MIAAAPAVASAELYGWASGAGRCDMLMTQTVLVLLVLMLVVLALPPHKTLRKARAHVTS